MIDNVSKKISPSKKYSVIQSLRKAYLRFLKIRGNPREIALGFALGLFVGMTPAMGFHTAIAVFFAALFKWNKLSAAVAVWISNPVSAPIVYGVTYFVGAKLLGLNKAVPINDGHTPSAVYKMLYSAPDIVWALTLGGIIIGLPLAIVGYYFVYSAVLKYREDIKRRLAISKEKLAQKKALRKKKKSRMGAASETVARTNPSLGKPERDDPK